MWIAGVAASHNGAVALVEDGRVRAAIQLERLQRVRRFPLRLNAEVLDASIQRALSYCLQVAGIGPEELDAIAASTPWALPQEALWPGHEVQWVPHHLAHAEYAVHWSDASDGLVLVVDGHGSRQRDKQRMQVQEAVASDALIFPGESETVSAFRFEGGRLELLYRMHGSLAEETGWLTPSVGQLWELASEVIFGKRDQAGKVMGLAAYGARLADTPLLGLSADHELITHPQALTGRVPYRHLARELQEQTSETLLELITRLAPRVSGSALYYSGGVALNVVANERVVREGGFPRVFMSGSCEDNGTAIGAALAVHHARAQRRVTEAPSECFGREYPGPLIRAALDQLPVSVRTLDRAAMIDESAKLIASGQVLGWFQGGSEFGPRALGNRSVFADPRSPTARECLNSKIKRRESFRPYGACVRADATERYFDLPGESPMMLRQGAVVHEGLPAISHVDGSCRLQTVLQEENPRLHELLDRMEEHAGVPIVLNTSMNVAGEPIVETPREAVETLLRAELDALAIGNFLVTPE